jgi:hypothetical protein
MSRFWFIPLRQSRKDGIDGPGPDVRRLFGQLGHVSANYSTRFVQLSPLTGRSANRNGSVIFSKLLVIGCRAEALSLPANTRRSSRRTKQLLIRNARTAASMYARAGTDSGREPS